MQVRVAQIFTLGSRSRLGTGVDLPRHGVWGGGRRAYAGGSPALPGGGLPTPRFPSGGPSEGAGRAGRDVGSRGGGTPPRVAPRPAAAGPWKVKRRPPWGVQQLRDSWSEDAMTKRETENLSERIHREYRYHPDEGRRQHVKHVVLLLIPSLIGTGSMSYYYFTGKPIWRADPQHILNVLRAADTSPRSILYLYRLDENEVTPTHVIRHREAHRGERERAELIFKITRSAFAQPSSDDLRRLEVEWREKEEMMRQEASEEVEDEGP
ncbi:unnamed protein product [Phytomonas sp. EM1]|nr:unnamed protein product [Phytomonas sp. EM1]|eukprot:CCW65349.1 unnamed protein product [Phytomonas sp. isolate EM1]